ncbi:MAG TPA: hypothetical protein VNQ79_07710 [Blastocatellia bacterium]|nr:hypothetical protein [Blastocatellia bacterium]
MTEQTERTKQTEQGSVRSNFPSSVRLLLSVLSSALLIVSLLSVPALAQRSGGKKTGRAKSAATGKSQTASRPALPGAQQCEGALEVVPRAQMTFIRKRRPASTPQPSANQENNHQGAR